MTGGAGSHGASPALAALAGREVILETTTHGPYARTAAVDVETGLEAHVRGPIDTPTDYLERLAMQKLARLLLSKGVGAEAGAPPSSGRNERWV